MLAVGKKERNFHNPNNRHYDNLLDHLETLTDDTVVNTGSITIYGLCNSLAFTPA